MYCIIDEREKEKRQKMEAFVKSHPNSHFLQEPRWAAVKSNWLWRGIMAYEEERLVGTMSLLIRKLPLGLSLVYAPRGMVCDRQDPYSMAELLAGAEALARQERAIFLMTDPDVPAEDPIFRQIMETAGFQERWDDGFGNVQAQNVFRLWLKDKTPELLLQRFSAKTRYNIRLAQRKGVQIRKFYGDAPIPEEVLESFASLNVVTGKRDHFLPREKAYFRRILQAFGRDAVLFMAYYGQRPIAGTIGLYTGGKGWYLYGASGDDCRQVMPNYLLQWEMICHAVRENCVFYDLRGVPGDLSEDNPLYGLYRFKKGFAGEYTRFAGLFILPCRPVLTKLFFLLRRWRCR